MQTQATNPADPVSIGKVGPKPMDSKQSTLHFETWKLSQDLQCSCEALNETEQSQAMRPEDLEPESESAVQR